VRRCGLDSSGLGQGPVAGSCEHGNEPSDPIKCWNSLTSCVTVSLSGRTLFHGVSTGKSCVLLRHCL
jgi:hypothetical protein